MNSSLENPSKHLRFFDTILHREKKIYSIQLENNAADDL